MHLRKLHVFSVISLLLVLSACSPTKSEGDAMDKPTEAMMDKTSEAMMDEATPEAMMDKPTEEMMDDATPEAMMEETAMAEEMVETPAWFGATLTNVTTGETFTINDLKGKVVIVETMAQWCSNCRQQQNQVKALHEKLGDTPDLVTIALDIDPNEDAETLKAYSAKNGFNWIYAVSPADVSREIGNLYTDQFLNPPSTPILIIDRKGVAHPLPFGIKNADTLLEALQPYLNESM